MQLCRFWGLTNQRISLRAALDLSVKFNWTLVIPHWRFNYEDLEALIIEPLSFLYDDKALQQFAKETGCVLLNVWDLVLMCRSSEAAS